MTGPLSSQAMRRIQEILDLYQNREAALLPILHVIRDEKGGFRPEDELWAADLLGLPPVRVREVVTFYALFGREPLGRHVIRVCAGPSCSLLDSENVLSRLTERLGIEPGETTPDGKITLLRTECLGNCDMAPCLSVDGEDRGRLTAAQAEEILREIG